MSDSPSIMHTLGDAGASPEIILNGTRWTFGHPTQRAKAELEKLCIQRALAELAELRQDIGPQAYQELLSDLRRGISAGDYRTFGQGWSAILTGPSGPILFALSLLRERHPEATEQTARDLMATSADEVAIALQQVAPPFCLLLVESLPAPAEAKAESARQMAKTFSRRATTSPTSPS